MESQFFYIVCLTESAYGLDCEMECSNAGLNIHSDFEGGGVLRCLHVYVQ